MRHSSAPAILLFLLAASFVWAACGSSSSDNKNVSQAPAWTPVDRVNADSGASWYSRNADGTMILFGRSEDEGPRHTILEIHRDSTGMWGDASVAPFSGTSSDRGARFYPQLDGVIFSSNRPVSANGLAADAESAENRDFNLWVTMHDGASWTQPLPMAALNSDADDFAASVASSGTVYFASRREGGQGNADIYRAELTATGFVVEPVPGAVNSALSESDVFIDPDERFMILTRTDDSRGLGGDDLFVSINEGGVWSEPEWLGPLVNTSNDEYGAWIADTGRLYVTTHVNGASDVMEIPASDVPLLAPFF